MARSIDAAIALVVLVVLVAVAAGTPLWALAAVALLAVPVTLRARARHARHRLPALDPERARALAAAHAELDHLESLVAPDLHPLPHPR